MEILEGYVERILFQNEENGYTVMEVVNEGEEITCFGTVPYIHQGEYVRVTGEYVIHPVYGEQLKIGELTIQAPKDRMSVERYLSSGAIKGIGLALAARIVNKFGEDTYRVLEEEPERLAEVHGISMRKAMEIADQLTEQRELRQAMLFLQQYGISVNLSVKIFQKYGQQLYEIVRENPYKLSDDISGVGFKVADEIAKQAGILENSPFRISCGLTYLLQQASLEGHTYLPKTLLFVRAQELLGLGEHSWQEPYREGTEPDDQTLELLENALTALLLERKIICRAMEDVVAVYLARTYYTELSVARQLLELNQSFKVNEKKIHAFLEQETKEMEADALQHQAVFEAISNGVFVLTGGPGTGKTTTINCMIRYFQKEKMNILLAAPTGRAAKRMTEATGYEAQTIHRLLELSGENYGNEDGAMVFERDGQNPLEADAIIIDEMSMVDIFLMDALLKAVVSGTRLILVGDVNQLASVGPGTVLRDIIQSGCFPVVKLTHIFRQAAKSDIVTNAHCINEGRQIALDNKSEDFFFLQRTDGDVIVQSIIYLVQKKLPPYVGARSFDVQVLSPMRKGLLGVENLNVVLQRHLNPQSPRKKEKEYKDGLFRQGDKVMQIKNNYQMEWEIRNSMGILVDHGVGVFNGDMGIVVQIDELQEILTVEFDECRRVDYPFSSLDELELAYAITIHKSQGSEYPAVVMPLLTGPRMLLNRNLLYTAVTRAKRCVTIVGDRATVQKMIENENEQKRYSGLRKSIMEAV